MKPLLATLTLCLSTMPAMAATTLASWNFNSDDGLVNTGSLVPSEGAGTLSLTGGTSSLFTSGSPGDPAGFPLDSGWSVGGYPAQGTLSGTAGFEGRVSSVGYQQLTLSFDYKTQPSGNKWFLAQATTDDGASWTDVATVGVTGVDHWFSVSLDVSSALPAAADQADFGFRVVAIFKPGTLAYEAAEAGYNGDFGLVIDRLTVQATPVPEAHAAWLALAGLGLIGGLRRRRLTAPAPSPTCP